MLNMNFNKYNFYENRCAFYLPAIYTGATILSEKEGGVIERVVLSGNFEQIINIRNLIFQIFIEIFDKIIHSNIFNLL